MSLSRLLLLSVCLPLILFAGGCSNASYYAQATKGQLSILKNRQSIEELIANPNTNADLRERLILVNEIRNFATTHLSLPDNRSYRSYSETGRPYVVWNVVAAAADSLKLKTWCFLFTGCVAYKGYFNQQDAEALNQQLVDQGYDTFLYGVSAYSTLGWFADPVLDTFIDYRESSLANLIFHELAHQVVYVEGDSSFNEAFATAVGYAGMRDWMSHRYPKQDLSKRYQQQTRNAEITQMVLKYRSRLMAQYSQSERTNLLEQKQVLFDELRRYYDTLKNQNKGTPYYDWWFGLELNNAHLSAVATYYNLVPAFNAILIHSADYETFYETVEQKSKLPKSERDAWLHSFLN